MVATPFDDTAIFPTNVSYGSVGGPGLFGEIAQGASGFEEVNSPWQYPRHEYDVSYGIKSDDDLHFVKEFFLARHGILYGFRYKDWADYKSCPPLQTPAFDDQQIGVGDASTTVFNIIKNYTNSGRTLVRLIQKPITGTGLVGLGGVEQFSGFTINYAQGTITFDTPPGSSVVITMGYQFHVPVRFKDWKLNQALTHYQHGQIPDLPLIEKRLRFS